MSQLSRVLRRAEDHRLLFWCPGCDMAHHVRYGAGEGPRWTWDGNEEAPTFSQSILVQWDQWEPPCINMEVAEQIKRGEIVQTKVHKVCHSFVRNGQIQFLGDCTHALAGQTVPLPDWPE